MLLGGRGTRTPKQRQFNTEAQRHRGVEFKERLLINIFLLIPDKGDEGTVSSVLNLR